MSYRLVEWSPDLDLSDFYQEAERRGFENNYNQKVMFDCFKNEKSWKGWMLEYQGKYVGGVCAHSFDDVMGPNTYRILARTCIFTDQTHNPRLHTVNSFINNQQCCASQFFIPVSIEWAGQGSRLFATSNANDMGSQQRVNRLWFPMQKKLGRFSLVKTQFYRGCEQNIWELDLQNYKQSLPSHLQWPCEFPQEDPRKDYVKL
jgi:hypothetical protein